MRHHHGFKCALFIALIALSAGHTRGAEWVIDVHPDRVVGPSSSYLTGACIEDVNHEVYGGIYSQMIFGESFQEPGASGAFRQLSVIDGDWRAGDIKGGTVAVSAGPGPKLVANGVTLASGEAGVEVRFDDDRPGNAGMMLKVNDAHAGADRFTGYEVSLESRGTLVLERHRNDWEPIRSVPCKVPLKQWVRLAVKLDGRSIEAFVDGASALVYLDDEHPLPPGGVALRAWQRSAEFRNLRVTPDGKPAQTFSFEPLNSRLSGGVSGMWQAVGTGTAEGNFAVTTDRPFLGAQSQKVTFAGGAGTVGIENRGLNRWGMSFVAGKPYEGCVWLRCDRQTPVFMAAESADGAKQYVKARIDAKPGDWQRYEFNLTPSTTDSNARFTLFLEQPGSVAVGYAFLQPGEWGRFNGLPVRRDVAEALVAEGLTVLRYGGSMINDPQYRWKKMIGPRDRRPPYKGTWYPYSSNGFGIIDFLSFCEAAGFLAIPDLDNNEAPQDIADFIEYVNGLADSPWGRRRAADGHPAPFGLKYIELGNEEAVDETYWQKFKPLAEAIWSKDPNVTPVVGDFAYGKPIIDPYHFAGAPRITSLAAHKKILDFAKARQKAVWFDVHIWNDQPKDPGPQIEVLGQMIDWLGKISPGADFKVCVFEENANHHTYQRALAHARTIDGLMRLGGDRVPIVCAANCLQCDGQNDNGWDQGLLFLSPSQVWPQPSYFVTRMASRAVLPKLAEVTVSGAGVERALDAVARVSDDGRSLTMQVTNIGDEPRSAEIRLGGFTPAGPARVSEITGRPQDENTAADPNRVAPVEREWAAAFHDGAATYTFPPRSFTVLRWQR